jgi:8-oxo-dGTP diphosphatase
MSNITGSFNFCVAAIIENPSGEILLVKRSPGNYPENIWDVVGGKKERFENPFDALAREIEEETGITEFKTIKTITDFYWFQSETSRDMIGVAFWCRTKETNVQLSDEHSDYLWIKPEKALKMLEHQVVKRCITKFINEQKRLA